MTSLVPLTLVATLASTDTQAQTEAQTSANDQSTLPGGKITTLSNVEVKAKAIRGTSINRLTPTWRETPQSITIIDESRIKEQNLHTLDDVMQYSPGITVQPHHKMTTEYSVRGFQVDSFQQDGVPVLIGALASSPEDMSIYDRVEILRGAGGLLTGSGNPAATVNLVPRRAPHKFGGDYSLAGGRWSHYRAQASVGGPLNAEGTLRGLAIISHDDRHFFYKVGKRKNTSLYGVVELDLAPATTLSLGAHHQRIRSIHNMMGLPFYSNGQPLGLPRSAYLDVTWSPYDWDTTRTFAGLEHVLDNGWSVRLNVNHYSAEARAKYAGADGSVDPTTLMGPTLYSEINNINKSESSLDGYISGPFQLFGRQHEMLAGGSFIKSSLESFAAEPVPALNVPVSVFNWDPAGVPEPNFGPLTSRGPVHTTQTGLYVMGRFSVTDPLKLIVGTRANWWKERSSSSNNRVNGKFTPYGGLVYELTPQWSAYASYARVFQPQTYQTVTGATVPPKNGTNYETGLKGSLDDGRLNVSFAVFDTKQNNRAEKDVNYPCSGKVCYYVPTGKTTSRGFETEVNSQLTPNLGVQASYTYDSVNYGKDEYLNVKSLRVAPRHIFRLWTQYTLPVGEGHWNVGTGIQAQSAYYALTKKATLRQGGYALLNLLVDYRFTADTSLAFNVNNVFDRTYYQGLESVVGNNHYGEPRSFMLTLRSKF